jgi:hypothetical protein
VTTTRSQIHRTNIGNTGVAHLGAAGASTATGRSVRAVENSVIERQTGVVISALEAVALVQQLFVVWEVLAFGEALGPVSVDRGGARATQLHLVALQTARVERRNDHAEQSEARERTVRCR